MQENRMGCCFLEHSVYVTVRGFVLVAKLGKDGKPETCRAITKIDYRTVRNRSAPLTRCYTARQFTASVSLP